VEVRAEKGNKRKRKERADGHSRETKITITGVHCPELYKKVEGWILY
jgi:hypothetical protein